MKLASTPSPSLVSELVDDVIPSHAALRLYLFLEVQASTCLASFHGRKRTPASHSSKSFHAIFTFVKPIATAGNLSFRALLTQHGPCILLALRQLWTRTQLDFKASCESLGALLELRPARYWIQLRWVLGYTIVYCKDSLAVILTIRISDNRYLICKRFPPRPPWC